jgi:hypothetical protein
MRVTARLAAANAAQAHTSPHSDEPAPRAGITAAAADSWERYWRRWARRRSGRAGWWRVLPPAGECRPDGGCTPTRFFCLDSSCTVARAAQPRLTLSVLSISHSAEFASGGCSFHPALLTPPRACLVPLSAGVPRRCRPMRWRRWRGGWSRRTPRWAPARSMGASTSAWHCPVASCIEAASTVL